MEKVQKSYVCARSSSNGVLGSRRIAMKTYIFMGGWLAKLC